MKTNPETKFEADACCVVVYAFRYALGRRSYAPAEIDSVLRNHIQDPAVQAELHVIIRDLEAHIAWETKPNTETHDPYIDCTWRPLLAFLKANTKGDKS